MSWAQRLKRVFAIDIGRCPGCGRKLRGIACISERDGVLGAMDTMYQRGKIQEESLYCESKKHDGSLPIVGVNTFLPPDGHGEAGAIELMRSSEDEKNRQVANVEAFRAMHADEAKTALRHLQNVARERKNTFEALMEAGRVRSPGSMSHALYDVGGGYRRNMQPGRFACAHSGQKQAPKPVEMPEETLRNSRARSARRLCTHSFFRHNAQTQEMQGECSMSPWATRNIGMAMILFSAQLGAAESTASPELASRFRAAEAWMDQYMTRYVGPGASAAVVDGQRVVWTHAFGYADLEFRRPATPDTAYSICSISKLFTSVAVMKLVEDGAMELDAELGDYLEGFAPSVPDDVAGEPITIRDLLSHASGLPREGEGAYWNTLEFPTEAALEETVNHIGRLYTPGTNYQYSNIGMSLLGKAASRVTGKSYDTYVHEAILDPLGLGQVATDLPPDGTGERFATGYTDHDASGKRERVTPYQTRGFSPAAGYVASVLDLAKFAAWQFRLMETGDKEVLERSTLRNMQRVHWMDPFDPEGSIFGLGFHHHQLGDAPVIGHDGYCLGHRAQLSIEPNRGIAVITMVNANDISPTVLAAGVYGLVGELLSTDDSDSAQADERLAQKVESFQSLEGVYRWPKFPEAFYVIPRSDGDLEMISLYAEDPSQDTLTWRHVDGDLFRRLRQDGDLGESMLFERDPDGQVRSILWEGYRYSRS